MLLFAKKIWKPDAVEIADSKLHGKGVFARQQFKKGATIETAPLILLTPADKALLATTVLYQHYFLTGNARHPAAIGLGYSSLYNHIAAANAAYHLSLKQNCIIIKACKAISTGEEITINYNGHHDDASPVYFSTTT